MDILGGTDDLAEIMVSVDYSCTRDRNATQAMQNHLNPLPRSVVRPNEYELLDGEWRFELDLEDRGLRERWFLGHAWASRAHWPHAIEECLGCAKEEERQTRPWQDTVVAWYEREFEIPQLWLADPCRLVQVTFGGCGYETQVWLNGHLLQTIEGEETHIGEYTSFAYELPWEYLQPMNRLTIRIADSLDPAIPRGKQESRVYKRGGIWYQTISGPVRSIWIEPVERNRLRSRLEVISTIEDRLVEFNVTTRIHDPGLYTLRLLVAAHGSTEPLTTAEYPLRLEAGNKRQRVALRLPEAQLWSPDRPNLHHLVAQLISSSGNAAQIEAHFGLRKIEARGQRVYLNNEAVYLDGILYQPGTAMYDEMRRHMLAMKELGCNLVRVHIAGIDPRIYDLADELGMLLWVEVPSPHRSSERSRQNHHAEVMRMLVIVLTHPSIVILSLYNEDWGAEDIATSLETRAYIARVYNDLRTHSPQVLVVDNDGWHHVSTEGRLESHLLTAHVYTPDIERWREVLDRLVDGHLDGVAAKPLVVGDPFFFHGQVPLIVSEWGGFGWSGYGGPSDSEHKAERISAFKRELRRRAIAGDVYTQAVGIEEEVNGLIDPHSAELEVLPGLLRSRGVVEGA